MNVVNCEAIDDIVFNYLINLQVGRMNGGYLRKHFAETVISNYFYSYSVWGKGSGMTEIFRYSLV
jgi:hypothetical protein